jgi:hypothetical protein
VNHISAPIRNRGKRGKTSLRLIFFVNRISASIAMK